jgi:hypothetical protein
MATHQEIRLFDSQWVNVVNHDNCYAGYSVEDAVAKAVKLTEEYMAKNFKDGIWPTDEYPNDVYAAAGGMTQTAIER